MLKRSFLSSLMLLALISTESRADSKLDEIFGYIPVQTPLNMGAGKGLLEGLILELSLDWNNYFTFRLSHAEGMKYDKSERYSDHEYSYETAGGMNSFILDFYPFKKGLFFSVGYVINNFKVKGNYQIPEGTSQSSGSVNLLGLPLLTQNNTATEDINVDGRVRWKESGPRVSAGYYYDFDNQWNIKMEVGALFFGKPKVTLVSDGEVNGDNVNDISEFDEEAQNQIDSFNEDAAKFDVLPIVNVGVNYRF